MLSSNFPLIELIGIIIFETRLSRNDACRLLRTSIDWKIRLLRVASVGASWIVNRSRLLLVVPRRTLPAFILAPLVEQVFSSSASSVRRRPGSAVDSSSLLSFCGYRAPVFVLPFNSSPSLKLSVCLIVDRSSLACSIFSRRQR